MTLIEPLPSIRVCLKYFIQKEKLMRLVSSNPRPGTSEGIRNSLGQINLRKSCTYFAEAVNRLSRNGITSPSQIMAVLEDALEEEFQRAVLTSPTVDHGSRQTALDNLRILAQKISEIEF